MDFTVEYYPFDDQASRTIIIRDCTDADDAAGKFRQQFGNELAERIAVDEQKNFIIHPCTL